MFNRRAADIILAHPVPAWQALRPSVVANRFEALRGSARTMPSLRASGTGGTPPYARDGKTVVL
jgi:hypothetical protein